MKTKKPRSGNAAKPARRTLRRRTARTLKTPNRRTSRAKAKPRLRKTASKRKVSAEGDSRAVAKPKRTRKRAVRRPKMEVLPIPPESDNPAEPAVGSSEEVTLVIPPEEARPLAGLVPEPHGEQTAEAEPLRLPQILLEGDEPGPPPMTGPGQKYVLSQTVPGDKAEHAEAGLPEAYGTGKLLLTARDPHWLYAHWDLAPEQQRQYNAASADRHLVVRLFAGPAGQTPVREVHVHPESRHWFVHVERAETQYAAELGYYRPEREWVTVATSPPTITPPDTASADQTVRFATIPAQVRLSQLAALGKPAVPAVPAPLEPAQEQALAQLVGQHPAQPEQMSSLEVPELGRGPGEQEIPAAQAGLSTLLGGASENISSPMPGAEQAAKGFWLNLHAELIVYGSTEPTASVTVGGEPVPLRPDGTFSYRVALPDGEYALGVSALSAEGDSRQAELHFTRRTERSDSPAPQHPEDFSV